MSRISEARRSVEAAVQRKGGAVKSQIDRRDIVLNFIQWSFDRHHCFNSIKDLTLELVKPYFEHLKREGIANSTMWNRLAAIRSLMCALKAKPDMLGITADAVGLVARDRKGKKVPIPDHLLNEVIAKAYAQGEEGFAIMLKLQRLIGHRGMESLMSIRDLQKSAREARDIAAMAVIIHSGAKNGKRRVSDIIHARSEETLRVIRDALVYARSHGGHLVHGAKSGLKSAKVKYRNLATKFGLVGIYSPHSLRYAYAVEKLYELDAAGFSRDEALSFLSICLGHGESRGRFISMVYGRKAVHILKPVRRKTRMNQAIAEMDRLIDAIATPTRAQSTVYEVLADPPPPALLSTINLAALPQPEFGTHILRCDH